jgi:hypothetical protein
MYRKTAAVAALLGIASFGVAASASANGSSGFQPVTLCHATHSLSNPYVTITVDNQGKLNGHLHHADDIIPAPEGGCPKGDPCSVNDESVTSEPGGKCGSSSTTSTSTTVTSTSTDPTTTVVATTSPSTDPPSTEPQTSVPDSSSIPASTVLSDTTTTSPSLPLSTVAPALAVTGSASTERDLGLAFGAFFVGLAMILYVRAYRNV